MSYITVGEILFILVILSISFAFIIIAGLWRAIELQNQFEDLAEKVGVVQATIDGVVLETIAQVNLTFDAAHDLASNPNGFQLWASNITYPFPFGPIS
jgi:nitrogen fixation-related uncharacterized protein